MSVRPIETEFMGRRFRSRLEARWAIVFELMGLPWQYETEGFETPHGRYLPDFWIPCGPDGHIGQALGSGAASTYGAWIEIKPTRPDANDIARLKDVCIARDQAGIVLFGTFDRIEEIRGFCVPEEPWMGLPAGTNELAFMAVMAVIRDIARGLDRPIGDNTVPDPYSRSSSAGLAIACAMQARRARFEHGESPNTGWKH